MSNFSSNYSLKSQPNSDTSQKSPIQVITELSQLIQTFDTKFILQLQNLRDPSSDLKNIILVFLTLFHDELDELIVQVDQNSLKNPKFIFP